MCTADPMTLMIAGSVLGIGTQATQIMATNAQAEIAARNARETALRESSAIHSQQLQVEQQGAAEEFERSMQGLREEARLRVAAGEAGVLGNTVSRSLVNSALQTSRDVGTISSNTERQLTALQHNQESAYLQAKQRIAAANASAVGPIAGLIQMGAGGLSGAITGYTTSTALSGLTSSTAGAKVAARSIRRISPGGYFGP